MRLLLYSNFLFNRNICSKILYFNSEILYNWKLLRYNLHVVKLKL